MRVIRTNGVLFSALVLSAALGACKAKDANTTDTTASAAAKIDSAGTPGNPSSATVANDSAAKANTTSKWTPANVLGFATVANAGEIAMGKLGEKKATSPAVKAFARQMVTDHSAMQAEGKTLSAKVKATADTTADDAKDLNNHATDEMKDLTDKAAGADWDKNYMDKMIDDHQNVLNKLQDASKNTTDADVRAALEKAVGKVQEHLTKAQDIKSKLK